MGEIKPVDSDSLPWVSAFLSEQFHPGSDDEFARPEVLRWQYLEWPEAGGPRAVNFLEGSRVAAHGGVIYTRFLNPTAPGHGPLTSNIHSWAAEPNAGPAGLMLLMQTFANSEVQYAFSFSEKAGRVFHSTGFEPVQVIPQFLRVMRPGFWRRLHQNQPPLKRLALWAIDAGISSARACRPPPKPLTAEAVTTFDTRAEEIAAAASRHCVLSSRSPDFLNHQLRYPHGTTRGYYLRDGTRAVGLALLHVHQRRGVRVGKILDCLLESPDADAYARALRVLVTELAGLKVDLAICYGGTPWLQAALRRNRFFRRGKHALLLRDKKSRLPRNWPFQMTFLESDLAFL